METIANSLNELKSFYFVARYHSFTKASEALPISKAQISKEVQRLETLLGIQLFNRSTRQVHLTEEGQVLYQQAQKIFELTEETSNLMLDLKGEDFGHIKITAPGSLGNWFVPDLVVSTREKYPRVQLEFDLNNTKRDLLEDKIDFALRAMEIKDMDLVAKLIGQIKDVIVVSKDFYKKHKKIILEKGVDSLNSLECLLHSHQTKWNTWNLQKRNKTSTFQVNGHYAVSSYTTSKALCLRSIGVAKLPLIDVKKELDDGELTQLFTDFSVSTHPLYLVYPKTNYRTRLKIKYRDYLLDWFKAKKEYFI